MTALILLFFDFPETQCGSAVSASLTLALLLNRADDVFDEPDEIDDVQEGVCKLPTRDCPQGDLSSVTRLSTQQLHTS